MIEEILCVVRRQIRSIVSLCEEFDCRRLMQKEQSERLKIVNDEIIFVPS
jgi:hypothetical protein